MLVAAVQSQNIAEVRRLLRTNAPATKESDDARHHALLIAAEFRDTAILEEVLHALHRFRPTPIALEKALAVKNWKAIRILKDWGAEAFHTSYLTGKALDEAAPEIEASRPADQESLLEAILSADEAGVKRILKEGKIEINGRTKTSLTPLRTAVRADKPRILKILLDHGADPEAGNREGQPPLLEGMFQKVDIETIKILLIAGADPNANPHGEQETIQVTPLHKACSFQKPDVARLLTEFGADPALEDILRLTPLQTASSDCKKAIEEGVALKAKRNAKKALKATQKDDLIIG